MSKEELKNHYNNYFNYLKDNDLEIELGHIYFLEKENAVQTLDGLKNPKREYLKEIIENF